MADAGPAIEPDETLRLLAGELADAVEAALCGWVVACVKRVATAWSGDVAARVSLAAEQAGQRARSDVGAAVRALLGADIDEQRTTPLALVRGAARYPTQVLRDAGVPPVGRDSFRARSFPEDEYDLAPASWADVDESLVEPALAWGAAKAFVHKRRHGPRAARVPPT